MAMYELWDERKNQTVGRYASKPQALNVVRDFLDRGDIVTVASLVLRESDWGSPSVTIASGASLVALARIGTGEEWTRSRRQWKESPASPGPGESSGKIDP